MKLFKRSFFIASVTAAFLSLNPLTGMAAEFTVDPGHSFINFTINHMGFSVMSGRFSKMTGSFTYDEKHPEASTVNVKVKTKSVDTNHSKRDKHIKGDDFLDVKKFPTASFKSTSFEEKGWKVILKGDLTLHGVTKPVTVDVDFIGEGNDPWGGFRRGYTGRVQIKRSDFGISYNLGPTAEEMELIIGIEGIRR